MRPRLEKLLEGKEELLYKIGMKLRPGPEDKPLKYRPGVRFQVYVAFITWFLKRYPDVVSSVLQNSTRGSGWPSGPKVEIITLPNGQRALHQEGELLNSRACPHDTGEQTLPVVVSHGSKDSDQEPAKVIYG